jgi:hypothetical protein
MPKVCSCPHVACAPCQRKGEQHLPYPYHDVISFKVFLFITHYWNIFPCAMFARWGVGWNVALPEGQQGVKKKGSRYWGTRYDEQHLVCHSLGDGWIRRSLLHTTYRTKKDRNDLLSSSSSPTPSPTPSPFANLITVPSEAGFSCWNYDQWSLGYIRTLFQFRVFQCQSI